MDYSGLQVGMTVQAESDGVFYAAQVIEVSSGKKRAKAPIKVHYKGFPENWDAWLGGDQLRSKNLVKATEGKASAAPKAAGKAKEAPKAEGKADYSGLKVGARLQAEYEGAFCPAEVVEVSKSAKRSKAPVKVRFQGYGAENDMWLGADKLKSKAITKAKADAPKQKQDERPPLRGQGKEEGKPAGKPDYSVLKPGTRLKADYEGSMYPAEVVEVTTLKKFAKAPVRVRYQGFGADNDAWLGADKLNCKALKAPAPASPKLNAAAKSKAAAPTQGGYDYSHLTAGMRVQAEFEGTFYPADVVQVSTGKKHAKAPVQVHFSGWGAENDSWVSGDKVRSKALKAAKAEAPAAKAAEKAVGGDDYSGLEQGMRVQAEYDGQWYAAEVVTVSTSKKHAKAPVKVHYGGMDDDCDEWLNADRLRSKAIKKGAAKPAAKGEGKGGKGSPKASPKSSPKAKAAPKTKAKAKAKGGGKGKEYTAKNR